MSNPAPQIWARSPSCGELVARVRAVRGRTEELAAPICLEDQLMQTMADVSPTRWHRAHTTWFFETFVLKRFQPDYTPFCEGFDFLFNSYYQGAGAQFARARRGTLGRPTLAQIKDYRAAVDEALCALLERPEEQAHFDEIAAIVELGLQHEQQHQELMLTDIKHVLANNPLRPAYRDSTNNEPTTGAPPLAWQSFDEGLFEIGFAGKGFAFDNEQPRHRVFLHSFRLATRPVTCAEFMEFIDDGGYEDPRFWLSLGWQTVQEQRWQAPLYWEKRDDQWWTMTLAGMLPVEPDEPVTHVSYFEADAFARWAQARLPTEAEWEVAAQDREISGNFVESKRFHPSGFSTESDSGFQKLFGDVWEWTASPYVAYPGFSPWNGTLGEYNGKFMCNQFVLRGGSCASPQDHLRNSYRNFFDPAARWQFNGFRLAS